jgi:tetratricopeptide (TPR) repeat protein
MQLYLQFKQYTLALPLLDQLLTLQPDNPELLQSKALAHFGLQEYEEAIATFTQVLDRDPLNPSARINRANACLRATQIDPNGAASAGRLDQARADYQELLKHFPKAYQVLYGLAEIAWRKQETNAAIEFSHQYLANATPGSDEYKLVSERLRQLQPKQL